MNTSGDYTRLIVFVGGFMSISITYHSYADVIIPEKGLKIYSRIMTIWFIFHFRFDYIFFIVLDHPLALVSSFNLHILVSSMQSMLLPDIISGMKTNLQTVWNRGRKESSLFLKQMLFFSYHTGIWSTCLCDLSQVF